MSELGEAARCERPLLIVDDREEVRTALQRFFEMEFEQVFGAATPDEAEACLRLHRPPLLLCDYFLGVEWPPATSLIPRWRREFPFLRRVAIMTGTRPESIGNCPEADAVFEKPLNMRQVTEFLIEGALNPRPGD